MDKITKMPIVIEKYVYSRISHGKPLKSIQKGKNYLKVEEKLQKNRKKIIN